MTKTATASREPRPPRKKAAKGGRRDDASLRSAILDAALAHVPFDGFTDKVLQQAGTEVGADRTAIMRLFPGGPLSLVETFSELFDAEMERRLAKSKLSAMKVREKIAFAVRTRLAVLGPHKEAARRAAAFLTLPPNAPTAATLLYRTVDSIWRAIGDNSTDFNFYTKRAILAGVYTTTLMRWFNDDSVDELATGEFLARRIENVMQFEKLKARVREAAKKLPSLSGLFSRQGAGRT